MTWPCLIGAEPCRKVPRDGGRLSRVALARELRSRTTMPLAWIARRLRMGRRGCLAWLLGRQEELPAASPAAQAVLAL